MVAVREVSDSFVATIYPAWRWAGKICWWRSETACEVESEILLIEPHGCDFFPSLVQSCARVAFLSTLYVGSGAGDCALWVTLS